MHAGNRAMADELTEDLLSAYADDELDAATRARVEARLAEDESWRVVMEEIEETRALVRGAAVREAPSGFWTDVEAVVGADADVDEPARAAPGAPVTALRSRRRTRWSIAAGVAAAAVIAAVIVVPTPGRTRPPVATMVDTHAARASLTGEPVSTLTPMGDAPRPGR